MIRVYKELLENALAAAMYCHYNRGLGLGHLRDYAGGYAEINPKYGDVIRKMLLRTQGGEENLESSINDIVDALYEYGHGRTDGDLIDVIVKALQLPYGRNAFNAQTFAKLRKALLLPSEMAGLTTALRQREMSCSGCDHKFQRGEMITFNGDGTDTLLYCTSCVAPTLIRCPKCEGTAPLSKNVTKAMQNNKSDCGCMTAPKVDPTLAVEQPRQPQFVGTGVPQPAPPQENRGPLFTIPRRDGGTVAGGRPAAAARLTVADTLRGLRNERDRVMQDMLQQNQINWLNDGTLAPANAVQPAPQVNTRQEFDVDFFDEPGMPEAPGEGR